MNVTRASNTRALDALAAWARRHGGRLIRAPRERSMLSVARSYQENPFGCRAVDEFMDDGDVLTEVQLGIDWAAKLVACSSNVLWPDVIHELGHVFAARERPGTRDAASGKVLPDEAVFFGWEYLMAKRLGPIEVWFKCNENYSITKGHDFGAVSDAEQDAFIQECLELGVKAGIIVRGKPVAIR